ncbi:hypothetical protein [Dactylosporangium matsuzakiense]|uniref:Excalibur calcium-binding domain-containing protein n=1 Tax=Dactylosporangium matsuzakiense TaxID=53360 RepID=A0A9W6KJI6_9ACTN|nr:hypothetical protein [Dactylosporangium matsuzakiense]UWZ50241.1 hypothetical protein Dmats_07550 [Dactylosporangium matsuzakiense]GLL01980.1 hypothetical protein GCM10017581_037220 [Dactylosporangium matsuzakiense]
MPAAASAWSTAPLPVGPYGAGPLPGGQWAGPTAAGGPHGGQPPLGGAPVGRGPKKHGWYLVLAAAVLGVFVFCGIVVAAAGNQEKPSKSQDVARNGALGAPVSEVPVSPSAAPAVNAQTTTAPPPTTDAPAPTTTTAPAPAATTGAKPATKAPTTKPPTTKPATKPTTKPPAQNCNPNYTPCVPNDPVDVDCAGGSGNGPSYVQGPVKVIGSDPYGLDTDHDGIGCE